MAALKANGNTLWSAFTGLEPGSIGETSVIAALIGAAILILTGVGAWRIMAGCLIGAAAVSELFLHFGGEHLKLASDLPTLWQLCVGGFAFGAVFMATDPVSAAATNTGKWIYGLLIGGAHHHHSQRGRLPRGHHARDSAHERPGPHDRSLRRPGAHQTEARVCQSQRVTVMYSHSPRSSA
jgi:Na+-translocating ferredoxin:NAD+ oxidoreductase RnfD subunit